MSGSKRKAEKRGIKNRLVIGIACALLALVCLVLMARSIAIYGLANASVYLFGAGMFIFYFFTGFILSPVIRQYKDKRQLTSGK